MKATIDFDDNLYRRLKIEAAKRGRSVREMVAEGVRYVLDSPDALKNPQTVDPSAPEQVPTWFGALEKYAKRIDDHSMEAVRASVAAARKNQRAP